VMAYSSQFSVSASTFSKRFCSTTSSLWYMASSLIMRRTAEVLIARVVGGAIVVWFIDAVVRCWEDGWFISGVQK